MTKMPLLLLLALPALAQGPLDSSNNYIYVQYGDLSYDDTNRFDVLADSVFQLGESIATIDWSEAALRLTEGYHFNKYVAVEGSLNFLGDTEATTTSGRKLDANHLGFALHVVGKYRFHRYLNAFGFIGGQYWRAETKLVGAETEPEKVTNESANISWGLGAYAEVTERMLVRLDWTSSKIDDIDYSMTSIGLGFSF
ncbi:MAG: porin family protein [Acidobacteriota bacterium]|nr:porin family protein [Acidobacteriota bacterium]